MSKSIYKVYIKNMVCPRCIKAVKELALKIEMDLHQVFLGRAEFHTSPSRELINEFYEGLESLGFEVLEDKRAKLVERIKNSIITLVQGGQISEEKFKLSQFLQQEMGHDYGHLSSVFSNSQSSTIEKFFIAQKIEKVKELLVYDELSLSEIAYQLGYSSVQHLSAQFKKVTGLTPGYFKKVKADRSSIDEIL